MGKFKTWQACNFDIQHIALLTLLTALAAKNLQNVKFAYDHI